MKEIPMAYELSTQDQGISQNSGKAQ